MLSGALAKSLVKNYNITPVAARKQISRASAPVRKLRNISFDNNQKFIYLDEHFNSDIFFNKLLESIETDSKAYWHFIKAVKNHSGFLTLDQLAAFSSSPIKPLRGHRSSEKIINDLLFTKILLEYQDDIVQINPLIESSSSYARYRAFEIAKKAVLNDFYDWARKINLVSFNKGKLLTNKPEFYKFQWCFTAPSYVQGLSRNKTAPGFLIADIFLGKQLSLDDVDFFLSKIHILRQGARISPFLPVLIMEGTENDAFAKLKSEGVLLGFIDKLFGSEYYQMLRSLVNIIENATTVIIQNPDQYFQLLETLSKLEGKASNLRGDVFELAVGYYYSQYSQYIEVNKSIEERESGKRKEIDVFVKLPQNELRIIECKGYNYPLDEPFVKKWLTENIPLIRKWIINQDHLKDRNLIFELWSTGGFEINALKMLVKSANNTRRYDIRYYGKTEILGLAKGHKNLERIVSNYFN